MSIPRRKKLSPSIPLSSMADIAFLLLIFFIVTSVIKFKDESSVVIPKVPKVEVIDQNNREDLWITKEGVFIRKNKPINLEDAELFFLQQSRANPDTVVFINGDKRTSFKYVEKAIDMLSRAGSQKVVFVTLEKKGENSE